VSSLRIEGLTKRYPGSKGGIEGLTLDVDSGETLVLVGPSGCGKSTTLRLIAGLEVPDAGRVALEDRDLARVPPQDRDVAMVFQGFALYPHMTAAEILAFPLRMRDVPKERRAARVREVAELLSIEGLLDRRPAELSGGEKQRVAMGRALVRNPKLFLFDEPLSNLDAALRAELRTELGALLRDLGTTSLYVTHDQIEAMTLGRRIAVLRAGKLEQVGTARELYDEPANAFVATFVGQPPMNLISFDLQESRVADGGPLVGFRPEHAHLEAGDIALPGEVRSVEPLGAETHVWVLLDGDAPENERRACVRSPGFAGPEPGARVTVGVARDRLHVFDRATGARA